MTKLIHLTTVDMSLELLLGHQIRAARDAGYNVVGMSAPGPWSARLEQEGIRHIPLSSSTRGWSPLADVRTAIDFWRAIRREQPDVLHTHNPKPGLYGRVLGRLAGVPIVVNTIHGLYATPDDSLAKRGVVYLLEALASRFSDRELVQSAEDAALMRRLRLAPADHVTHLGNGVDLDHFDRGAVPAGAVAALRVELGLTTGLPVVAMVGRLVAEKGWREFFAAVRALREQGEKFHALAIGPQDHDKADALTAHEIKDAEADGVQFLGLRSDMREIYALTDLFVLPSHREGFPRAAMEAAAMGVPVVATDIRGCREVVDDGINGRLFPVRSVPELITAMAALLDAPKLRAEMGRSGRLVALKRFDARTVSQLVLDTYREAAAHKGIELAVKPDLPGRAYSGDALAMARLHVNSIPTAFLSSLGTRFLAQVYRGLIGDPDAVVLVVRDAQGDLTGFIAGCRDTSRSFRRVLIRRVLPLLLEAVPALGARPSRVGRVVETLRYSSGESADLPPAELLSMAVAAPSRSRGLGSLLMGGFLKRLAVPAVRVVVGSDNHDAIRFYQAQGFAPADTIELHQGERSEVLVWRSSSL